LPDDRATAALSVRRRVRPNAATAHAARADAMIAARDADALPALFADEVEVVMLGSRAPRALSMPR
jgi:hypothetical protein